jgi:8-oxo-dGTP diphosphatase
MIIMEKGPRVGAAVLIEHNNKFLLGERNKKNANGMWVIPGGGVNWGEKAIDAAVREIKEETNLDIKIIKLICVKEIIALHADYHSVVFFYLAKPLTFDIISDDDVSDLKFFSIEEIKKLNTVNSVREVLTEAGFWK